MTRTDIVYIYFFTDLEAVKAGVPFLLDAEMQPITAVNAWLRDIAQDGATSRLSRYFDDPKY